MKKFSLFAILLVVALVFTSCGGNRRIVGTWHSENTEITFRAGGSFQRSVFSMRGVDRTRGSFVLEGDYLRMRTEHISGTRWTDTHSIRFIDRNTFILNERTTFRRGSIDGW